ncbi:hypothetical protein [Haloarcula litorea]|uniref:hypothetical protein n=1 Tax=Haloarcula litorea TaxID=3032579 RepID=UPI0023E8927D|nr:hypothetical protein [Halomicroarcula sp. GDY20]
MSEKTKTEQARECIPILRDVLEEVLEEGDSGRGPPLTASIDAAHALEGLDRGENALERWDEWEPAKQQRGRHICESTGRPRDMTEDHDLDTTLSIVEQTLAEYKNADGEVEKQTALANYLSAVNTLVAHSHRFAGEAVEDVDWMLEQKRAELQELLEGIE